jgi:hypothetical protein
VGGEAKSEHAEAMLAAHERAERRQEQAEVEAEAEATHEHEEAAPADRDDAGRGGQDDRTAAS